VLNGIFNSNPSSNVLLRKRFKGIHQGVVENPQIPEGYILIDASELTSEQFEKIPMELYSKFYNSFESFCERSWAKILLTNQNDFCAFCYAAAWGGDTAEIDVYTETSHRKKGLAELVVSAFVSNLKDYGKIANWDCFLDNFGSRALAKKCGFDLREEYWMISIFKVEI
jgi:RimJ/RimL family protein N-acetyltransferase